jgi:hypothetical protein
METDETLRTTFLVGDVTKLADLLEKFDISCNVVVFMEYPKGKISTLQNLSG